MAIFIIFFKFLLVVCVFLILAGCALVDVIQEYFNRHLEHREKEIDLNEN